MMKKTLQCVTEYMVKTYQQRPLHISEINNFKQKLKNFTQEKLADDFSQKKFDFIFQKYISQKSDYNNNVVFDISSKPKVNNMTNNKMNV